MLTVARDKLFVKVVTEPQPLGVPEESQDKLKIGLVLATGSELFAPGDQVLFLADRGLAVSYQRELCFVLESEDVILGLRS